MPTPAAASAACWLWRQDGALQAYLLAGDTAADSWVLPLLQQGEPAARFGQALLAASRTPPQPVAAASRQVCACHDVSEARIVAALQATAGSSSERLACVQQGLRCGTECGSCLPAVKALVQQTPQLHGAQSHQPPALVSES
jgi:assimilatory nitrate reductase catalytic subunit